MVAAVRAALAGGADVSVTVRLTSTIKTAIAGITEGAWTTIEYTDAIRDEATGEWISRAEVAEIAFTAFAAQKTSRPGPGPARRAPDPGPQRRARTKAAGQGTLFDVWRFHAFFTTAASDVARHRRRRRRPTGDHAIIEQVHADLKNSALAHLPSGKFTANAAWLVLAVIAFNLTRAAATLTEAHRHVHQKHELAKATHRDGPSQADHRPGPGRVLGPPDHPAPAPSLALGRRVDPTVRQTAARHPHSSVLTTQAGDGATEDPTWNTPTARSGDQQHARVHRRSPRRRSAPIGPAHRWIEADMDCVIVK